MHQPGVGDLGTGEVELLQLGQRRDLPSQKNFQNVSRAG